MKGKVAVCLAPNQPLEFREYTIPDPERDAILVKVRLCNICGSDLHIWHGNVVPLKKGIPQILGHEMVGTIEKMGSNINTDSLGQPLSEGDRVVYSFFRQCGHCIPCIAGEGGCAGRHNHWLGVSSDDPPHFNGGFGEYYYLGPDQWIFRVPQELPDTMVSPVNCAASEVFNGLRKIEIRPGDTVVIQGAGGLGLYAIAMAREMGASTIVVFDGFRKRLDLAKQFGANHILHIHETRLRERRKLILEVTKGRGADVVIEVAGVPEATDEGIRLLRDGGRYLWIGNINRGAKTSFDPSYVVRGALTVKGVCEYESWTIPGVLDFLARTKDKYPYESILSHQFRFEDINEALALAESGEAIRVSVVFEE